MTVVVHGGALGEEPTGGVRIDRQLDGAHGHPRGRQSAARYLCSPQRCLLRHASIVGRRGGGFTVPASASPIAAASVALTAACSGPLTCSTSGHGWRIARPWPVRCCR